MSERKKILWLVSWYPNKYDPFDGDFIQRHARAAALYDDIHVIFVRQSETQEHAEESCSESSGLTEQIIYLPKANGLFGKYLNYRRWKASYKAQVTKFVKLYSPHLIHVHIPWKVGLIALWVNKKFGIRFAITEHWGIYNTVVEDNIYKRPFYFRYLLKKIYRKAAVFTTVSSYLAEGVRKTVLQKDCTIIPNTVDTDLFTLSAEKYPVFTFLHVSNMVPLKNVEGILYAFQHFLLQTQERAQLVLVGNNSKQYKDIAAKLGLLNASIFFRGEIPYGNVAKEMQHSHVLVVNSNIETFSCVIGEALCCGLPVIATEVGGIPELVGTEDGRLIDPGSVNSLTKAMADVYKNWTRYDKKRISRKATEAFSIQTIGKKLHTLYEAN